MKTNTSIVLLIIALTLLSPIIWIVVFIGIYTFSTVEIPPNLYVEIPNTNDKLLIKEWKNCWRSGANIYYVNSIGLRIYIGKTKAYEGVTPFKDGRYSITYEPFGISVRWEHRFESEWWEEDFFYYPILFYPVNIVN